MAGFMSRGVSSSKINSAGVREDRFRKGKVVLVGRDDDDALARATVILAKFTAKWHRKYRHGQLDSSPNKQNHPDREAITNFWDKTP